MITCANNTLTISHPDLEVVLQKCAGRYVEEWLPKLLVEDVPSAMETLLARDFNWISDTERQSLRQTVLASPHQWISKSFPEIVTRRVKDSAARSQISFQRTLRLPDDGNTYPLPPGLGRFPLRPIMPYAHRVSRAWAQRGGVLMPMYQAEALWLSFTTKYPYALKVGTGLVNAITGEGWAGGLPRTPQGYLVLPEQPWLDGYCVKKGVIRQFVAARLGSGYTAEEQLHGTTQGGLQLEAFPLKPAILFEKQLKDSLPKSVADLLRDFLSDTQTGRCCCSLGETSGPGMGLGAGGRMKQEIYEDPWEAEDWDLTQPSRVWIHLCDAVHWFQMTGELPPQKPIGAKDYARHGLPWFDYYRDDLAALEGGTTLDKLKSIFALSKEKGDKTIPQEESVTPGPILVLGPHAPGNQITEWDGQ